MAVKLVNQGLAAELSGDRFELERRILARLEHPNVARLLDAGMSEFGQPYLVMEWVDGVPLDEWRRVQAPSLERRLALWLDIADAVAYAHRNLVVHRDLKPSNVLVAADGTPKLVDFGIARLLEDGGRAGATTRTQRFTPLYASPEQIRGQTVSTSTDVFGLGLLLAELVTGRAPFGAPTLAVHDQARAVLEDEPAVGPEVHPDLAAVIRMALRKEPDRRYASADQMADDVRRYLAGRPVVARPETWPYRARRFVGRNRLAVALGAAAVLALLAATAVALRQAARADDERARAEQVTSYLTGLLGATPNGFNWTLQNRGVSLRVIELADVVGARIAGELRSQPEAEATLRSVLAMTYFQMGEIGKSREHVERAAALQDQLYAPDDPRRLSVALVSASVDISLGEFARAEQRVLEAMRRWPDAPATYVAGLAANLGTAQLRLGKVDEAEASFRRGVAVVERDLGPQDPSLALLASNFSLVFQERGQFAEAATWLERAAAISRTSFREASTPLAWALVNLANVYRFEGKIDQSLAAATESLSQFEAALGPSHYSTMHALAAIAYAKAVRGEPDAETYIRRGIASQAPLPPDNYERAVALSYLGAVLLREGKLDLAREALEPALAMRRKAFAAPNWRIAETAGWLGETLARLGQRDRAMPLLNESLETFRVLYGDANARTIDARAKQSRWVGILKGAVTSPR